MRPFSFCLPCFLDSVFVLKHFNDALHACQVIRIVFYKLRVTFYGIGNIQRFLCDAGYAVCRFADGGIDAVYGIRDGCDSL